MPPSTNPTYKKTASNAVLTHKQERFVQRYVVHGNGALAAREAGYSAHTAKEVACENLTKPHVLERWQEYIEDYGFKTLKDVPEEMIVGGIAKLAIKGKAESTKLRAYELLCKAKNLLSEDQNTNVAIFQAFDSKQKEILDSLSQNGKETAKNAKIEQMPERQEKGEAQVIETKEFPKEKK